MPPSTDSGASVFLPQGPYTPAAGSSGGGGFRLQHSLPMPALTSEPADAWLLETLERYEKPLLKYALGQCGDREMARDAVQDTFLSLASEVAKARPQNLSAWLFSVCRNRLIDIRRKQFRLVPLEDGHLEQDVDGIPAPSARIETEEKNSALLRMVESLPERERELVRL